MPLFAGVQIGLMMGYLLCVSHFIGVVKLCDSPTSKDDAIAKAIAAGAKVILGEILFTDRIGKLTVNKSESVTVVDRLSATIDILTTSPLLVSITLSPLQYKDQWRFFPSTPNLTIDLFI